MAASIPSKTSPEERLWAALSHFSVFLFGFGLVAPLAIWVYQRDKSRFATFHALQSLGYQVVMAFLWLVLSTILPLLIMLPLLVFFVFLIENGQEDQLFVLMTVFQAVFIGGILGSFLLYFGLGLLAAVMCLTGRDFRYPLFGGWLSRYPLLGRFLASRLDRNSLHPLEAT